MYYPIIDKLKDVMAEIGQGGGGSVVIDGVQTSSSEGTWTGSFSDIINALNNGTPCILKIDNQDGVLINVYILVVDTSSSIAIGYYGNTVFMLNSNNTFSMVQQ